MIQTLGLKGGRVGGEGIGTCYICWYFPGMGKDSLDGVSLSSVCTPMYFRSYRTRKWKARPDTVKIHFFWFRTQNCEGGTIYINFFVNFGVTVTTSRKGDQKLLTFNSFWSPFLLVVTVSPKLTKYVIFLVPPSDFWVQHQKKCNICWFY